MAKGDAAKIRSQLGHPIVDGDSHWIESVPVMTDYVRAEGGTKMAEEFAKSQNRRGAWYDASPDERMQKRISRGNWWITTANTFDFATSMIPALQESRMDELGIDYSIIYPTRLLTGNSIPQEDTRKAVCRAYNKMVADIYAPHKARLTPAALIPCLTPQEAIDEVEYAVNTLGLKVGSFKGSQRRPIPEYEVDGAAPNTMPYYVDALGLDNLYDYDPLWQKCIDLGISVTVHQGSNGWASRMSTSNGEFNRLGHAASSHEPMTKSIFLGGVVRRFPDLTFSFLEGGVGYGVMLLANLVGGWQKRTYDAMKKNLKPTNIDIGRLRELIKQYGYGDLKAKGDEAIDALRLQELAERETESLDDYAALGISTKAELIEAYSKNFYFGCEADDPTTAWAFDARMPGRLKALLGTDLAHWDVPDFAEAIPEAWEMVEDELITAQDFRDFTFTNPVECHVRMNPDFFKGTIVEDAVKQG